MVNKKPWEYTPFDVPRPKLDLPWTKEPTMPAQIESADLVEALREMARTDMNLDHEQGALLARAAARIERLERQQRATEDRLRELAANVEHAGALLRQTVQSYDREPAAQNPF